MQTSVVMVPPSTPPRSSELQAELDLLCTLVNDTAVTYPWNPTDPDSEAYLLALEQAFLLDGLSERDVIERSQSLFEQLEQCWQRTELSAKFAAIPRPMLDAIVYRAKQILAQPVSLSERLIHCVEDCFPHWVEADWQVLVRPFAYAMRDGVESMMSAARSHDWMALSEIEQARLTLAAAYDALSESVRETSSSALDD
jgi:hypothetical protein